MPELSLINSIAGGLESILKGLGYEEVKAAVNIIENEDILAAYIFEGTVEKYKAIAPFFVRDWEKTAALHDPKVCAAYFAGCYSIWKQYKEGLLE